MNQPSQPADSDSAQERSRPAWQDSYEWRLFADWCAATGHPVLPTTWQAVTEFLSDIPCSRQLAARRLRAIYRVHRAHAYRMRRVLPDATIRASAWRSGIIPARAGGDGHTRWLSLPQALELLPVYGHPYGVAARRDGLVLVAVGLLGLTRAQTAGLATDQVTLTQPAHPDTPEEPGTPGGVAVAVAGRTVPPDPDPARCPACAVTRWCRALAAWHHEWHTPRAYALEEALYDRPAGHDCARPVPPGWREARIMTPSIGPEGLPAFTLAPVTTRTIPRITAARLHPAAATGQAPSHVAAARPGQADPTSHPAAALPETPRDRVPAWATRAPMTTPARRTLPDPDGHLDALLEQLEDRIADLTDAIDDTLTRGR